MYFKTSDMFEMRFESRGDDKQPAAKCYTTYLETQP